MQRLRPVPSAEQPPVQAIGLHTLPVVDLASAPVVGLAAAPVFGLVAAPVVGLEVLTTYSRLVEK